MIFLQKLQSVGCNLIVKGQAYRFDTSGMFQGVENFKYINIEPVKLESFITQGNVVEKVSINENGDVMSRSTISLVALYDYIASAKSQSNCLGVLIRNSPVRGIACQQFIVVYRQ